jgi:hypothetical protein
MDAVKGGCEMDNRTLDNYALWEAMEAASEVVEERSPIDEPRYLHTLRADGAIESERIRSFWDR